MMAGRFAGQAITWVITIVVIRLLSPADYGLMAMAMVVIGFLVLFEELGLGAALVQAEQFEHRLAQQILGLLIVFQLTVYILIWLTSPFIASFFGEPALVDIIRVIALQLPVQSLGVIPDAVLQRRMDFRGKSIALLLANVSGSLVTLACAIYGAGVWSLVIGNLCTTLVRVSALQLRARYPCAPRLSFVGLGRSVSFGGFVTLDRMLWYVYSQSDVFIIGRVLGKELLGFYSVAMHLAALPMTKVAAILNEVGFSAFSRLQHDRPTYRSKFIKAARILALVAFPVFFGISSIAPEVVGVFLGERWQQAVLPMQVLGLVIPLRLVHTMIPTSLFGCGRADLSVWNTATACLLMPTAFLIGVRWGLLGVSLAWAATYPLYFLIASARAMPVLGLRSTDLLGALARPVLSAGVMYGGLFVIRLGIAPFDLPGWVVLVLLCTCGAMIYGLMTLTTQGELVREVVALLLPGRARER